jgi:hypothetical protein
MAVDTLEAVERNHITRALNDTNWVIHGKKALPRSSASIPAHYARAWRNSVSLDRENEQLWI